MQEQSASASMGLGPWPAELFSDHDIRTVARSALNSPTAEVDGWWVEPVDYPYASPTTAGLFRCVGSATLSGSTVRWSVFIKLVRAWRHWPLFHVLPTSVQGLASRGTEWRHEADIYAHGLSGCLPPGLRLPHVHLVKGLGDDRLALVMEEVTSASCWSVWPTRVRWR